MRLDSEYILSTEPEEQKLQLEKALRDIARSVNGVIRSFTPVMYGSGTAGTLQYTKQEGWYLRQAQMVDYWFQVYWKSWADFAGYMYMGLPLKTWMSTNDIWAGSCMTSDIDFANAQHTYCVPIGVTDSYHCCFMSGTHSSTRAYVNAQSVIGGITGHIRYIGQPQDRHE